MMRTDRHAQKKQGQCAGGFQSASPLTDNARYYVCHVFASRAHGLTLYTVIPLSAGEAEEIRKLDERGEQGVPDGRRRQILDAHKREVKLLVAKTDSYRMNEFIPAATALDLIRETEALKGVRL